MWSSRQLRKWYLCRSEELEQQRAVPLAAHVADGALPQGQQARLHAAGPLAGQGAAHQCLHDGSRQGQEAQPGSLDHLFVINVNYF